jgi:hypothetical protein
MRKSLKIFLFLALIVTVILGAGFALQFRKLPDAASVAFIQSALGPELALLREVAADSAALDFAYGDGLWGNHAPPPEVVAFYDNFADLRALQERAETITNPLILTIAIKRSDGHHTSRYVFPLKEGLGSTGWAPFSRQPTLGAPAVSWLLRSEPRAIRYAELVATTNQLSVGFDFMLDMDLLEQRYAKTHPPFKAQD